MNLEVILKRIFKVRLATEITLEEMIEEMIIEDKKSLEESILLKEDSKLKLLLNRHLTIKS